MTRMVHRCELTGHDVQEQPDHEVEAAFVAGGQIVPGELSIEHLAGPVGQSELALFVEGEGDGE